MQVVSDLHLHSKYSRAVSPQMMLPMMAKVAAQKGIDLLTTGDWTHPLWFKEIQSQLEEAEEGIYQLKDKGLRINDKLEETKEVRFMLTVEIANIFTQGGKGRRIHNLVFSPSFETCAKINKEMVSRGYNIASDGRPIIGFSTKNLLQMILEIDERCLLIPCHAWTPWFGMYGQMSGFTSIAESFEELAPHIYGIETGLSSDPEMNWQIPELQNRSILSFSDAHSLAKMGREATVFELESLSYENIRKAIMQPSQNDKGLMIKDKKNKVLYTIEFYPEEGKYHYSGHRNCKVSLTPDEQRENNGICPVCKRHVTDGVMRRVQELSNVRINDEGSMMKIKKNAVGLQWFTDSRKVHPPYVKLVPLNEIIAESIGSPVGSVKVKVIFDELVGGLESELYILLKAPIEEIEKAAIHGIAGEKGKRIADGVKKVREGTIEIIPGYDGVYGVVKIWPQGESEA